MIDVKIGGVPEHFNYAWYLTLKEGAYKERGIALRWMDYFGGTGQMCEGLRNGDIDMAVILTEGILKDIIAGNPSKIVQAFVSSPLIWGIHVAAESNYQSIRDVRGKVAAISRFGSGSHLMAYLNAQNEGWDLKNDLNFKVIGNLTGAIESLGKQESDYFMWEKFTTKPLVDSGIFRRIGEYPTPWPCFVVAARTDFIENHYPILQSILEIINLTTSEFKFIPSIDQSLANRYGQKLEDIQEWMQLTEWSQVQIDKATLNRVQAHLFELEIIPKMVETEILMIQ